MSATIGFNAIGARTRAALIRQPGEAVKLFASWWDGPPPRAGDGLRTPTGRRYLIREVGPAFERNRRGSLQCVVLPAGRRAVRIPGRWFDWSWRPRK